MKLNPLALLRALERLASAVLRLRGRSDVANALNAATNAATEAATEAAQPNEPEGGA